jgi:hypothetical protein
MNSPISASQRFASLIDAPKGPVLRDTAQFKVNQQGDLVSTSTHKLGRLWTALFRDEAGRQANRAATHAFIDHVRVKYGPEAGFMAANALADRVERGNPLSMRAIRALEGEVSALAAASPLKPQGLTLGSVLGGGANNQVFEATFKLGDRMITGALKEVPPTSGLELLLRDVEIDLDQGVHAPTFVIDRNLASLRLADKLGTPVLANSMEAQTPEGKPALTMELVHGDTAETRITSGKGVVDSADLRRGLVALQLNDFLTAQSDRNMANIMLKREGDRDIPVGIDNDICFLSSQGEDDWYFNAQAERVGLPMVLDPTLRDAVLALSSKDLEAIMGPNLAVGQRLESAVARLEVLQAHVRSDDVLLIENGQWHSPQVQEKLIDNPANYWRQMMHPS